MTTLKNHKRNCQCYFCKSARGEQKSPRKGLSLEQEYGKEKAEKIRIKLKNAHTGTPLTKVCRHNLSLLAIRRKEKQGGKMNTPEAIEKMRKAAITQFKDPAQRELRRQMRIKIMSTQQTKDTGIEKKVMNVLSLNNIKFEKQKPLLKKYVVDIFIKSNIVIECDGDYWHNRPGVQEKDKLRNVNLTNAGYNVLRFWEHEINANIDKCFNIIKKEYEKNTLLRSV